MRIEVTARFQSEVHHGSGMSNGPLVDRAFLRTGRGVPYLAGSALKGKFRHAASVIEGAKGNAHAGGSGEFCRGPQWCTLCRVFGCPSLRGAVRFSDAFPLEEFLLGLGEDGRAAAGIATRATTAIDRHRRVARNQHLFTTEVVASYIEFGFAIEGDLSKEDEQLLRNCTKVLTHFGAGAGRGLGRVEFVFGEASK